LGCGAWTLAPGASGLAAANGWKKAPGPAAVETALFDWNDARRNRIIGAKVYAPSNSPGAHPVIVFSHGLGGTREGYAYLGRHWASHGYVAVHLQHPGSDDEAWRGAARPLDSMRRAAADPLNAMNRPMDVRFAIDQLLKLNAEPGRFTGRLDTNRIGMAGHSFGAFTTLAVAGQVFGPNEVSLADSRVTAAIAMSPTAPRANPGRAFGQIRLPLLHLTGTRDDSPIGDTTAAERRVAFDHISGAEQFLVIFNGADHMVFSGRSGLRGDRSKDDLFRSLILQCATAFWDAFLKGDAKARKWLAEGGLTGAVGTEGTLEIKPRPVER